MSVRVFWNVFAELKLHIPSCLLYSLDKMGNIMFALTQHGGHMGFFEGDGLFPQPLTWMDKTIVEYTNAICQWEKTGMSARQEATR